MIVPPSAVSTPIHSRLAPSRRRGHARRHPARGRARGVLRLQHRRGRRSYAPHASPRAATWRACSRSPASRSAARCSCTITRRGVLEPSDADLEVAARMHDDGVGFGIIDNDARDLYVVVEVPRDEPDTPLDTAAIDADLGPDGPIARLLPKYEDRPAPARARCEDRKALQRRRRRTARGRHRDRKVVGLPHPGAAMGRGERRAHGGVHQHDQPAGTAGRQGPAVSRRARSTTSRCGSHCSRVGATTSA